MNRASLATTAKTTEFSRRVSASSYDDTLEFVPEEVYLFALVLIPHSPKVLPCWGGKHRVEYLRKQDIVSRRVSRSPGSGSYVPLD